MPKTTRKKSRNQIDAFRRAAVEVQASLDPKDFDRMLGGIAKAPPPETVQDRKPSKTKKPAKYRAFFIWPRGFSTG